VVVVVVVVVVLVVVVATATKYQMAHISAVCFKSSLYYHNFRKTGIIISTVQCDITNSLPSHLFRFVHSAMLCIMSTCIWQYTSLHDVNSLSPFFSDKIQHILISL